MIKDKLSTDKSMLKRNIIQFVKTDGITDEDLVKITEPSFTTINEKDLTMNSRLKQASEMEPLKMLFDTFIFDKGITIIAGQAGKGKTTLAMQIAEGIAGGKNVLGQDNESKPLKTFYFDFEMGDQQLLRRYEGYVFPEIFFCPNIDTLYKHYDTTIPLDIINNVIKDHHPDVMLLDNITALVMKSPSNGDVALELMNNLKQLTLTNDIAIIVIAHTPKIPSNIPLKLEHVAGSSIITNIADNVNMLGCSSQDESIRYLKQVKNRNAEMNERVLVLQSTNDNFLGFTSLGYDYEKNLIPLNEIQNEQKFENLKRLASKVFGQSHIRYNDAYHKIMEINDVKERRAKGLLSDMRKENLVIDTPDGKLMLNGNEYTEIPTFTKAG